MKVLSAKRKVDLTYELKMDSAFAVGTGAGEVMTANSLIRDANGELYIPGSTIKGVLRHNCTRLVKTMGGEVCGAPDPGKMCFGDNMCAVCSIFGSPYFPSPLFYSDAKQGKQDLAERDKLLGAVNKEEGTKLAYKYNIQYRTRNSISRARQVSREGALFTMQCADPGLVFNGKVTGYIHLTPTDDPGYFYELILLLATLEMLDGIGSSKSSGLGKCHIEKKSLHLDDKKVENTKTFFDYLEDLGIWLMDKGAAV